MASIIKVDKLDPQSGTALEVGSSGDTINVPSGATLDINSGATLTNSGTATGFATIAWQSVVTASTLTAVAGRGYPINTTSNACTVTLPAGSVGDTIEFVDYAGTWDTNFLNLTANGSEKIKGSTDDWQLSSERQGIKIVYVDATQGWEAITGVNESAPAIHPPRYDIDFLVIAGGGSGGSYSNAGGGGAGGYRTATEAVRTGTEITITVGDGGASATTAVGNNGSASSFSGSGLTTISSAGGGGGGKGTTGGEGLDGGSGGGGGNDYVGGASSPVTSPVQGYAGGDGLHIASAYGGGGGGGSSEVGEDGSGSKGGDGGDGVASSISGSSVTRGGGGGGGTDTTVGAGGAGGGGAASKTGSGTAGTVNTGGGGGANESSVASGAGGKGVVILSMPDANYSTTTTGSPTVATGQGAGSDTTTLIFTGDGSYTT